VVRLLAAPAQLSAGFLLFLSFAHSYLSSQGSGSRLAAGPRHAEEMELQRARRRRDELGHEPLCDRIRRGVLRESDTSARSRDLTAHGAWVDAERRGGLGERALQHVAQDKRSELCAAQGVPADEIAQARPEQP